MEAVIETQNLWKIYNTHGVAVEALRGVELQVAAGEFVAVMGPSGCGKSTLLHLLGGLDHPTQGDVFITGIPMNTLNESQRAVLRRKSIGIVFQAYNLLPNLSVADNIELPGLLLGDSPQNVTSYREYLLKSLGISTKAQAFPGELSGGEQQRVAIARAMTNKPAVLLVDEPTGNLDTTSGTEVMNLLQDIHEEGQTILLVTHDAKVAGFAERVIFMRDGRLVDQVELDVPGDGNVVLSRLVELEL
ncbi:MAG: ATP-binding cassette domain-containing protein [Anaerolineales bacterium]|nr:ATP-binding cassette domain-containing protein [Anaerolineales bacterium]